MRYKVGKYHFGTDHNVSAPGKTISESDCSVHKNIVRASVINNRNNGHVTFVFEDKSKMEWFITKEETTDTGVHWSNYTPEMIRNAYELV